MATMMRMKVKAVVVVFVGAVVLAAGVVGVERAGAQGARGAAVEVREKAAARVAAAEKLVEAMEAERDVGNVALTPSFIDMYGGALRRLAEARVDVAVDAAGRVKAAEAYVRDCAALRDFLKNRRGEGVVMTQWRLAEYYVADAEYLLAKVRG